VQAPQMAWPQPYFVPVRPKSVRKTQSSGLWPSVVTLTGLPLSVKEIVSAMSNPLLIQVRKSLVAPAPQKRDF
jgi:hypothetical protein